MFIMKNDLSCIVAFATKNLPITRKEKQKA